MSNVRDVDGLFRAVKLEDCRVVEKWCQSGGDVNVIDPKNFKKSTPLHWAAYLGCSDVVTCLLNHGADMNAQETDKKVPLHLSAFGGHYEVTEILLKAGADYRVRDTPGKTPCEIAIMENHIDVAMLFPDYGEASSGQRPERASVGPVVMPEVNNDQWGGSLVPSQPGSSLNSAPQTQPSPFKAPPARLNVRPNLDPYEPPAQEPFRASPIDERLSSKGSPRRSPRVPDVSEIPEAIHITAGAHAYPVEGTFTLVKGGSWEGMPLWECQLPESGRTGCVYSGTNGLWIITEDVCHMSDDSGLVTSAHKHDGMMPYEVTQWETHNGDDWVVDHSVKVEAVRQAMKRPAPSSNGSSRQPQHQPQPQPQHQSPYQQQQHQQPPYQQLPPYQQHADPYQKRQPKRGGLVSAACQRLEEEEEQERVSWFGQEDRSRRHIEKRHKKEMREVIEEYGYQAPQYSRHGSDMYYPHAPAHPAQPHPRDSRSRDRRDSDDYSKGRDSSLSQKAMEAAATRALLDPEEYELYLQDKEKRRAERRMQRRLDREEYRAARRAQRRKEREYYKEEKRRKSRSRSRYREPYGYEKREMERGRSRSRSRSRSRYGARGRSVDRERGRPSSRSPARSTRSGRSARSARSGRSISRSSMRSSSRASRSSRRSTRSRSRSCTSTDSRTKHARPWLPPGSSSSVTGKRVAHGFTDYGGTTRLAGWEDSPARQYRSSRYSDYGGY